MKNGVVAYSYDSIIFLTSNVLSNLEKNGKFKIVLSHY